MKQTQWPISDTDPGSAVVVTVTAVIRKSLFHFHISSSMLDLVLQ